MSKVDVAVSNKKKAQPKTGSTKLTKGQQIKALGDSMFGGLGAAMGFGDKAKAAWEKKNKNG